MRPQRDEKLALRELKIKCQASAEPTLSDDECMDCLESHRIAKVWAPSTVVQVGDIIVPTVPTGWMYKVSPLRDQDGIPGGITGTTEPRWPLDPRWPSWEPQSIDDGTVRFLIFRQEILGLWDIAAAIYDGLMLHATKSAPFTDGTADRLAFSDSQVHAHWMALARTKAPLRIN